MPLSIQIFDVVGLCIYALMLILFGILAAIQNSLNCELHREKDARQEVEDRLHEASEREDKDKQQISNLEAQLKNLASAKVRFLCFDSAMKFRAEM